jgi:hypothetical protein
MKNLLSLLIVLALIIMVGIGCGLPGRAQKTVSEKQDGKAADNKSLTDKGLDIAMGDKKIGIAECDEVVDLLNREIENPDDDFVTKAVKKTAINKVKEKFKEALDEKNSNKAEMARTCRDFKENLEMYKSEDTANTN